MLRSVTAGIFTLLLTAPAMAGTRNLTWYLDGGVVTLEVVVSRGYAEVPLSGGMVAGTLRVKPEGDAVISRVQTIPATVDPRAEKGLAALDERRDALGDRLKALESREEIFKAAARSQSAKAPRKSKSNPEPVTAIRQGTDFALARLEEVYRARRTAEKELKGVEARRLELARKANVGGSVARIWLQSKSGRVTVEYAVAEGSWKPLYDLRLDGSGAAKVSLMALLPESDPSTTVFVSPLRLSAPEAPGTLRRAASGDYAAIVAYTLPVAVTESLSPRLPLTLLLTNTTAEPLPAGDVSCYWKGEFRGTALLTGLAPGERKELLCGGSPAPVPVTVKR